MGTDSISRKQSIAEYTRSVRRVLLTVLALNVAVASAKVSYGYVIGSIAMTSDGFHSFFDGFSSLLGLTGIWLASAPPDEGHPYGHRKYETLFTIFISLMIFATCLQILRRVYQSLTGEPSVTVTDASFLLMAGTITINILVMRYESRKGRHLGSEFLIADSMHTKSDIFVSLAVVAGLFLTGRGFRNADTIAAAVVTLFIARIGYQILKDASRVLVDTVRVDTQAIEDVVNGVEGVMGCHEIRTRGSEHDVYLDLHLLVENNLPTEQAHDIAETVEKRLRQSFPSIHDVIVHVEPESVLDGREEDKTG
jgi:cation diffusion facilitator family transporter